jgi:hypothetical protein
MTNRLWSGIHSNRLDVIIYMMIQSTLHPPIRLLFLMHLFHCPFHTHNHGLIYKFTIHLYADALKLTFDAVWIDFYIHSGT